MLQQTSAARPGRGIGQNPCQLMAAQPVATSGRPFLFYPPEEIKVSCPNGHALGAVSKSREADACDNNNTPKSAQVLQVPEGLDPGSQRMPQARPSVPIQKMEMPVVG